MNQKDTIQPSVPEPNLDSYTDMSVGEILRRTREHYGQTLGQVEGNLRIRASQLEALEQENLAVLPGRVYAIGFVRSYAEYLGLDGDKMVHLFKAQSVGKRAKPELHFPVSVNESKLPNIYIVLFSLVALILLIAYWVVFHTPSKYVEAIPPVPEMLKKSSVALLNPALAETLEGGNESPSEDTLQGTDASEDKIVLFSNKMELLISEDSWVEIKNSKGKMLLRQVLNPGDKYVVPKEEGLVLSTGNAGGITVFIDGKEIKKLGLSTQVKRNIVLEAGTFLPR